MPTKLYRERLGKPVVHCRWVSNILVHRNHPWRLGVLCFEHFTKESCRCLTLPLCTEHQVQGIARPIHGTIQILPRPEEYIISSKFR